MEPLNLMPGTLYGGESIVISDILIPEFTPATHALVYHFSDSTGATVTATANNAGTGWNLSVPPATTLTWKSGSLAFIAYATASSGGRVTAVDSGAIMVTAAPSYTSWAKTALTAVEAAIAGRATDGQTNFAIGDMSVGLMSFDQLMKAQQWLKAEVAEDGSNRPIRIMRTRFI